MKGNFLAVAAASLLLVALAAVVSCDNDEVIWHETITARNSSDHDVTDLKIMWDGFAGGTLHGPPRLDVLRKGEEHTFTVGVSYAARDTVRFGACYTMNGRQFDSFDDDLSLLDKEHNWPSRLLKQGFPGIINIGNEGFELEGGVAAPPYS